MKYLDTLNEMNDAQKALKNRITGRESRGQMLTPGKHSTGGSERGQKKEKGKKPEPSKHREGRLLRTKKGPNPKKGHIAADDLVKDFTAGPEGKLPEHTEYKRMALMMAEALGYRVDEALPAVAGALARGAGMLAKKGVQAGAKMAQKAGQKAVQKTGQMAQKAGQKAVGMAKEKAVEFAANRMQKKEEEPGMEVAWTVYKQIGMAISEAAREAYTDKESQAEVADKKADGGFAGPMARGVSKPGGKGVEGAATKDKFVRSSIRRGGKAIQKAAKEKLGVDANPDKMATKNLAQVGKQLNKKRAKARGEGVPAETPDIKKAAMDDDRKKMAGPPEGR